MAKENGAIVTIDLDVRVEYTCSGCGRENTLDDRVFVTGSTGSILALKDAGKKRNLASLLPGGLAGAGLSCRCGCGHREPWARMCYTGLNRARNILLWLLAAGAVGLYLLHTGDAGMVWLLLGLMGLCALGAIGITLYKKIHSRSMMALVQALPESALPRLQLK